MIVYIEDSIIENFFVTFLLCLILAKLFCFKIDKKRLVLASLFSGGIATFYSLINFNQTLLIFFKLCCGYLIIYIFCGKTKLFAKFVAFVFLTALFAGVNILIYYFAYGTINITNNFATHILLIIMYAVYIMVQSCLNLIKKNYTINNFVYSIKILNNKKEILTTAFLDSGNTLLDYDNKPVFIITFALFKKIYKDITLEDFVLKKFEDLKNAHYLKSGFANGSGKILVFEVECFTILGNKNLVFKNAKLGVASCNFNKNFGCNVLLNINAFASSNI